MPQLRGLLITLLFVETVAEKKYCWYFEGDYPVYFVTGYFIRRRVHPYPPPDRPEFNVAFTRQPIISPGLHQAGFHNYGDSETAVISTVYQVQTHPGHVTAVYSAVPSHYRQPPPSYEQVMQDSQKK